MLTNANNRNAYLWLFQTEYPRLYLINIACFQLTKYKWIAVNIAIINEINVISASRTYLIISFLISLISPTFVS